MLFKVAKAKLTTPHISANHCVCAYNVLKTALQSKLRRPSLLTCAYCGSSAFASSSSSSSTSSSDLSSATSKMLPWFGFKRRLQFFCLLCSVVLGLLTTAVAKPTLNLSITQHFPTFTSFTQQIIENRSMRQMKTYSGKRLTNDSLLMIYYHDSTIAVTELGPQKLLLSCELIEIYNDKEGQMLLKSLSKYNRPLEISFDEMLKLMDQCEYVDKLTSAARDKAKSETQSTSRANNSNNNVSFNLAANIFPKSPLSILSGIIPGTKWCGTGDIATTYSDLGTEPIMDRCCRQHDLCPVKIRAYQSKYDLMNESLYTKSHCICDDMLFDCLKRTNTSASQLMGSIYFNLVQVPCLAGKNNHYQFRAAKQGF